MTFDTLLCTETVLNLKFASKIWFPDKTACYDVMLITTLQIDRVKMSNDNKRVVLYIISVRKALTG